jgi:hypothetical protein
LTRIFESLFGMTAGLDRSAIGYNVGEDFRVASSA